jgi:hypothetical protein
MKFVRDEIRFEHTVLGNRISAYLASQAFLMTAFAISARVEHRANVDMLIFSFIGIPVLAQFITHYIIHAVDETIERLAKQRSLIYTKGLPLYEISDRLRPEIDHSHHNMSLHYASKTPRFFRVAWYLILIWGVSLLVATRLPSPTEAPSTSNTQQTTN